MVVVGVLVALVIGVLVALSGGLVVMTAVLVALYGVW